MVFPMFFLLLAGCPDPDKDETGSPEETPPTGTGTTTTEGDPVGTDPDHEYSGPCEPPTTDTTTTAGTATSQSTFEADADGPAAEVLVTCVDTSCTNAVLDASRSTGEIQEWYGPDGEILGNGSYLTVSPDAASVYTLAVRTAANPNACDGMDVILQVVETELAGGVAPRVIITPLWITSTTTRTTGCNFTAGIGGCITDAAIGAFESTGSSVLSTGGTPDTLSGYRLDLATGVVDRGFAVWSAWDYLQTDNNTHTGSDGTLPTALFKLGKTTTVVTVGGTLYTDYALFGWSVNKGYTLDLVETKYDDGGTAYDQTGAHSTCSLSGKGTVTW